MVKIYKSSTYRLGESAYLTFYITQHYRDEQLINSLVSYFGCGKVYIKSNKVAVDYTVTKIEDLTEKILPFFDIYKVVGEKSKDLDNFKQVAQLIKKKNLGFTIAILIFF